MPSIAKNTTKARRVLLPVSAIVKPDADELRAYGSQAYIDSGTYTGDICRMPGPDNETVLSVLREHDPANCDAATFYNATTAIDSVSVNDLGNMPEPVIADMPGIVAPIVENVEPAAISAAPLGMPSSANDAAIAKAAAARAVAAFYSGASLPFKSAYVLKAKSAINFALHRAPTERSAGLLAAILTYCDVQPGTLQFVRGSGRVPGSLLGYTGPDAERLYPAGPESGGLSNMLGSRAHYVSGPIAGPGCENAVFRIDYSGARANMLAHNVKQADGEHLFSAPLALLDLLHATPAPTVPDSDVTL